MNPPTPVDAVAQLAQANGGSATRQAIQAALASLAADGAAQQQAASQQALATEHSTMQVQKDAVLDPLTSAVPLTSLQAQRSSLAPPATTPAAGFETLMQTTPVEAAAMTHNVSAPPAMPLQGVLAVPVALSALQTQPTVTTPRAQSAAQHERLTRVQRREGDTNHYSPPDDNDEDDAAGAPEDTATSNEHEDSAAPDPQIGQWLNRLTAAGQDEALRDLRLSRHVLLVLPQRSAPKAAGQARAVLLSASGALALRAHWWPGAASLAPTTGNEKTTTATWQRFRLFRDGDLLVRGGLRTRAGSVACRLLLGASSAAAANAALGAFSALGGLNDTATARLLLTERARVAQALVTQWTLLLLVVPEGVAHV